MKILVTAGGTVAPIDRVRGIANAFTGKTGARIAREAHARSHIVTLLTSHPDSAAATANNPLPVDSRWELKLYQTFDELQQLMSNQLRSGGFDAIIHSAAVSDYRSGGVFAPGPGTAFQQTPEGLWSAGPVRLVDRSAGKVKSDEPELWLRLVKTPKLIDLIRTECRFAGLVVKFKLEVDVDDRELLEIAERSRIHSNANLMVANTLEQAGDWAFVGPIAGKYERVPRSRLPAELLDLLERLHQERSHG